MYDFNTSTQANSQNTGAILDHEEGGGKEATAETFGCGFKDILDKSPTAWPDVLYETTTRLPKFTKVSHPLKIMVICAQN